MAIRWQYQSEAWIPTGSGAVPLDAALLVGMEPQAIPQPAWTQAWKHSFLATYVPGATLEKFQPPNSAAFLEYVQQDIPLSAWATLKDRYLSVYTPIDWAALSALIPDLVFPCHPQLNYLADYTPNLLIWVQMPYIVTLPPEYNTAIPCTPMSSGTLDTQPV